MGVGGLEPPSPIVGSTDRRVYSIRPKKNDVLGSKFVKNDILLNLACLHVYVGMQQSIST
jgi:hypothetical protein